jgi:hypothetical protein
MAVRTGFRDLPEERASITNGKEVITFDRPLDFVLFVYKHPEVSDEIKFGMWVWTHEEIV